MHLFSSIKKAYGNQKISRKFFLIILIATVIPMLIISGTLFPHMYSFIISRTVNQDQQSAAEAMPLLQGQLDAIEDAYMDVRSCQYGDFLFPQSLSQPLEEELASPESVQFSEDCQQIVNNSPLSAIRIYVDFPEDVPDTSPIFSDDSVFRSMDKIRATYWYGIFYSTRPSSLFCPPLYMGIREQKQLGDCAYIHPAYIHTENGDAVKCYIVCYYTSSQLCRILTEHITQEGGVSYITNDRDAMITSTNDSLSGIYYMNYRDIQANLMSSNSLLEKEILGESVYVSYAYLDTADWFLVTVTPTKPLLHQAAKTWFAILLLWIVLLIFIVALSAVLSSSIAKRIEAVSRQMSRVKYGGPPIPMGSPDETDEIGELINSYNYMARKINSLLSEQKKASEELRLAEFNSLQAQINPHFLYNTMAMIDWMAQQGRTEETHLAIRSLAQFYRLTLSRKSSISTLEAEIEHVSIYVRLQNMRFEDSISFVIDVPDNLMEYQIPRLTLQPLIENAILHGILEKSDRTGTIVLTGWIEDNTMVLLLSDDGVGIPPEQLQKILSGTIQTTGSGNHIAVYNTHRRLQILYGSAYGLSYRSTPGEGTEVEIRLPAYTGKAPLSRFDNLQSFPLPRIRGNTYSVSAEQNGQTNGSPEKIIRLNEALARDKFNIETFHTLFQVLPKKNELYIISHLVQDDFPAHTHSYYEVNYLCSGTLINEVDGHAIAMSPGDILIMNRKATHAMHAPEKEKETLVLNLCFSQTYLQEILGAVLTEKTTLGNFLSGRTRFRQNFCYYPVGRITKEQDILYQIIRMYAENQFRSTPDLNLLLYTLFSALSGTEPGNDPDEYQRQLV